MKYFLTLFTVYLISFNVKGQVEKEPLPDNDMPVIKINSHNRVYGKILDHDTRKPIAAASVQLIARVNNPVTNEVKDSVVAAMLSAPNGDFSFENIYSFDSLHILLSAVGYDVYSNNFAFAKLNRRFCCPNRPRPRKYYDESYCKNIERCNYCIE